VQGFSSSGNPVLLACKDPFGKGAIHLPTRAETKEENLTIWSNDFGANTGCDDIGREITRERNRMVGEIVGIEPMMLENIDMMCTMMASQIGMMQQQYAESVAHALRDPNFHVFPEFEEADADNNDVLSDTEATKLMKRFMPPIQAILCDPELEGIRAQLKEIAMNSCTARVHWDFFCDEKGNCAEKLVCSDSGAAATTMSATSHRGFRSGMI